MRKKLQMDFFTWKMRRKKREGEGGGEEGGGGGGASEEAGRSKQRHRRWRWIERVHPPEIL